MTNQLYRVDCKQYHAEYWRWYRIYLYAGSECSAIAYARDTEDEDGPMIYGYPERAIETTMQALNAEAGPIFPAGYWWASDSLLDDLNDWRKENAPCRETLDLFEGVGA